MNEEIITNGIDVSECAYYNKDNEPYCCEIWENECEAQNCYFKQLKRLQQENEELKEKVNSYICNANCYKYKEANKYKHALEEIKQMLKIADKTPSGETHFEYMDKAREKAREVLNVEY